MLAAAPCSASCVLRACVSASLLAAITAFLPIGNRVATLAKRLQVRKIKCQMRRHHHRNTMMHVNSWHGTAFVPHIRVAAKRTLAEGQQSHSLPPRGAAELAGFLLLVAARTRRAESFRQMGHGALRQFLRVDRPRWSEVSVWPGWMALALVRRVRIGKTERVFRKSRNAGYGPMRLFLSLLDRHRLCSQARFASNENAWPQAPSNASRISPACPLAALPRGPNSRTARRADAAGRLSVFRIAALLAGQRLVQVFFLIRCLVYPVGDGPLNLVSCVQNPS